MKNRKDNAINSIAPSKKWIHLKTKVFDKSIVTIPITNPATTIDNRKKIICNFQLELQLEIFLVQESSKLRLEKQMAQPNDSLNGPGLGLRTSVLAALDMCLESKQTRPIN